MFFNKSETHQQHVACIGKIVQAVCYLEFIFYPHTVYSPMWNENMSRSACKCTSVLSFLALLCDSTTEGLFMSRFYFGDCYLTDFSLSFWCLAFCVILLCLAPVYSWLTQKTLLWLFVLSVAAVETWIVKCCSLTLNSMLSKRPRGSWSGSASSVKDCTLKIQFHILCKQLIIEFV